MRRLIPVILLTILACSLPRAFTPTPSPPPPSSPAPIPSPTPFSTTAGPTATPDARGAIFTVSVLVDLGSEPIPLETLDRVLADASQILFEHTGITFGLIEATEGVPTSSVDAFARQYIAEAPAVPNGLVVFSFGDDDRARTFGGYSVWVPGPAGFHNDFVSPVAGDAQVYVAVLHWGHRYARCGYGDTGEPISPVSVDGECSNQPGTACVEHNGYSFCSNALGRPYAETPTAFLSANIVHEFLHPFGVNGVYDHYGTQQCIEAMGWLGGGWVFSHEEAERSVGMCPNVFAALAESYQP
jgi:hypothetical protein